MKKVIAIDFDRTLFENKRPEIGMPIAPNINRAKNEKTNGTGRDQGRDGDGGSNTAADVQRGRRK